MTIIAIFLGVLMGLASKAASCQEVLNAAVTVQFEESLVTSNEK